MFLVQDPPHSGAVNHFGGPEIVDIGVTCRDDTAVITVAGELDVSNRGWLFECLHDAIDAGVQEIVIDMEHLAFMDSTGRSVLMGANKRIRAAGGTLKILTPMPAVTRLLSVTGTLSHLTD
jgi:anti-anti-sigma factor